MNYTLERFSKICFVFSFVVSGLITGLSIALLLFNKLSLAPSIFVFFITFAFTFNLIKLIPTMQLNSRKALLESDLLYSIRHLLLSLESGTALINSLESVSKLNTKSSIFFKELVFDISLGIPIEEALTKAIEYSPSKAYTKILLEISTSLETGADLQKTLKNSLEDITKNHLILIKEYGKKLNPMSMFYMMIGTIMPSLGTAGLIVASSLLPGIFVIDLRILLAITFLLLILQLFFVLAFRSLKPAVME